MNKLTEAKRLSNLKENMKLYEYNDILMQKKKVEDFLKYGSFSLCHHTQYVIW